MMYQALDWFFMAFHSLLIVFNLFGWIWKPVRKLNLYSLLLTGFSWVGLGIFYGMGYCPLTHWHWNVLYELGSPPQTSSYVAYLFDRIFNFHITNSGLMDKFQADTYINNNKHSTLVHLKAMNKKFAFTAVRKGPRRMEREATFKSLNATIAIVSF